MSNLVRPFSPILELGLTELVGINEQVDQNDYSGSVSFALSTKSPRSGEILGLTFYSTGGDELAIDGQLYFLDAYPAVASGDTALSVAEWKTVIGHAALANGSFVGDGSGKILTLTDVGIHFHDLLTLYAVLKLTSATAINSAGGDDELFQVNGWYRRES